MAANLDIRLWRSATGYIVWVSLVVHQLYCTNMHNVAHSNLHIRDCSSSHQLIRRKWLIGSSVLHHKSGTVCCLTFLPVISQLLLISVEFPLSRQPQCGHEMVFSRSWLLYISIAHGLIKYWHLSQDANKANGTCSMCHAVWQLHHKDGTVHRHGPRHNLCPGSYKAPIY